MSAAASYWRNAVRHPEDCGIGNIRRTMDYSEFGEDLKLPIGCLEKGAVPIRISTYVQTAVSGGTPAVTIGTSTDPDAFAIAADIAAGSTGYKTAATGAEMGKALAADTMFFAYISASAATGKFTTTVEFANRRESVPFREDATDSGDGEEEGGGGEEEAPAWVPADAKIHIDLVGGTPQGRAWVDGTGEVDVDTLLGTDPNTEPGWGVSGYDEADLTPSLGLVPSVSSPAFIGAALVSLIEGATLSWVTKRLGESSGAHQSTFFLGSADGEDAVNVEAQGFDLYAYSWNGDADGESLGILNSGGVGVEATNKIAMTVTATRLEAAGNGNATIIELTLLDADRPAANPLIAAMLAMDATHHGLQSITIYDPLPSTSGLSELSES